MAGHRVSQRVEMKVDRVRAVLGGITSLIQKDVLVGIPETVGQRENEPVNNATLGYIHEFGAPAANIPARPHLLPGIRAVQDRIIGQFKLATNAALSGEGSKTDGFLDRAGVIATNSVKQRLRSNIPPPLKPATIRGRKYSRGTKSRRAGEKEYLALIAQGAEPGSAQSAAGIVALVNTGQLLRAYTWVLRRRGTPLKATSRILTENAQRVSGTL